MIIKLRDDQEPSVDSGGIDDYWLWSWFDDNMDDVANALAIEERQQK